MAKKSAKAGPSESRIKIQVIGSDEFHVNATFAQWCHQQGVTVRAIERPADRLPGVPQWMASTVPTIEWVKGDGMLQGVYGNGETIWEAVQDLVAILSEKKVMVDMKESRRLTCPQFGSPRKARRQHERRTEGGGGEVSPARRHHG